MRTFVAMLSLIVCSWLVVTPLAIAQESPDIQAITQAVLQNDPDALLLALNAPIDDVELPDPFSGARLTDPNPGEGDTISAEDLTGGIGNIMYSVTYSPTMPGNGTPMASPAANQAGTVYNAASLNYIVLDHELDDASREEFATAAQAALEGNMGQTQVETITIDDTEALLISTSSTANGLEIVIQWIAIPVGTVMVISQLMLGGEQVDIAELQALTESLALAGVNHLGMIVGPKG